MNIVHVSAENFGSYKSLTFDLEDIGLTLISGDTGAGKSTLLDVIAWTLYGTTSKEGSADEIKAWDGDGPTEAWVTVEIEGVTLWVCRVRGPKNDLYWLLEGSGDPIRGKDLVDTQRLLEARLGVSKDLFLLGSYLTQFSQADTFFIAKAKDRREVLESIADQDFAIKLGERASEARKSAKKEKERIEKLQMKVAGQIDSSKSSIKSLETNKNLWDNAHKAKLQATQKALESFDKDQSELVDSIRQNQLAWNKKHSKSIKDKKVGIAAVKIEENSKFDDKIEELDDKIEAMQSDVCKECGAPRAHEEMAEFQQQRAECNTARVMNDRQKQIKSQLTKELARLEEQDNPYSSSLEQTEKADNPHGELLKSLKSQQNPFMAALKEENQRLQLAEKELISLDRRWAENEALISQLTWVYDKSFELRAICMQNAVDCVHTDTNAYLERFFDAPIRVELLLEDSDKLEVRITNDGHECSFRALSGGERTMLKLSFVLSLMKAAQNKAGVQFHQLFLDEPFHGLSADLKVKAFGLLQQLETEYASVLVIDHSSELKAEFQNVFEVIKTGGHSVIEAK